MAYRISRLLLEVLLRFLFRIRFFGRKNIPEPPYLIVSNHASYLDPPMVGVACKKYSVDFMAKKEMFDAPVLGAWTRSVGCIPVDRDAAGVKAMKEALRRLKKKRVVAIFPEGRRSDDGSLQEAKRGVGFLVAKARVPVVPVYIDGSAAAMPKEGHIRFKARIDAYIGRPILFDELSFEEKDGKTDYEAITAAIMERIAGLKENSDEK